MTGALISSRASFFLHKLGEAIGKANQLLTASARKCPTLVSTSHEAQQVPKGAVKCGAWLRDQEEEEAYGLQRLCFKWLSQMLLQLGHGNSLLIVLPHPSPA